MEFVLLLIAAACVVVLIRMFAKDATAEKEEAHIPANDAKETSATGVPETPESAPKEVKKTEGPPKLTIYEFSAKRGTKACPFCDGENIVAEKQCKICGRDI